jgi:hypothetical protein
MYDMGVRVVNWSSAHPDDEPGFGVLLAQLQALVVRMGDVITVQRNGFIDTRAARSRKKELRSEILAVSIAHLAQIGGLAAREVHERGRTFRFQPAATSQVAFQSASRAMLEAAQTHREGLVKHGCGTAGGGRRDAGSGRRGEARGMTGRGVARREAQ